ncbi:MAG: hypothetical protein COB04_13520 [Gammaproteobacteria bacterium]|nr:MAG: hypothetical protein COB04_13520 [Gammaproteobacteria bacterium]
MNLFHNIQKPAVLIAALLSFFNSFAHAEYDSISPPDFQKFLTQYQAKPSLLREQPELLKALNKDQLSEAIESLGLDHFHYLHPVVIKGDQFPKLVGRNSSDISLATVRGGKLISVPSQIDDLDTSGWIYVEGQSSNPLTGTQGVFDSTDELIFMYRDTGSKQYIDTIPNATGGEVVQELVFTDNKNQQRYAYVINKAKQLSTVDYVSFDLEQGKADTTFYNFKVDPNNVLDFQDFKANVGDWQDHRLLDAIFFEINTGIFSRWTTISLDNFNNFEATPVAVIDGPIRAAVLLKIWVKYGNIPLMRIWGQLNVYDQSLAIPLKIEIPGGDILAKTLVDPKIDFLLDFNGYEGARIAASGTPEGQFGVVDGVMSDFEKNADMSNDQPWLWMESGHSWDLFATAQIPKSWPAKLSLAYLDDFDDEVENENFPGAWPRAGFRVSELPTDSLDISLNIDLRFPDTVGKAGPHEFAKLALNPPVLQVQEFKLAVQ